MKTNDLSIVPCMPPAGVFEETANPRFLFVYDSYCCVPNIILTFSLNLWQWEFGLHKFIFLFLDLHGNGTKRITCITPLLVKFCMLA